MGGSSKALLNEDGEAVDPTTTLLTAVSSTVKIIVGTGVIAVPYAVMQAGWLIGAIGLVLIGLASSFSMKTLIASCQEVRRLRKAGTVSFSGSFLAEHVEEERSSMKEDDVEWCDPTHLATDDKAEPMSRTTDDSSGDEITVREISLFTLGKWGMYFSDFVLISAQVGGCVGFAAFIADGFASVVNTVSADMDNATESTTASRRWMLCVMAPILSFLCCLRSTTSLERLAVYANFVLLVSFVAVLIFGFGTADITLSGTSAVNGMGGLSSFFGLSLFAFAAQSECMSVEQFLPEPIQKQYSRVLDIAVLIASAIYVLFGISCYVFFKDNTNSIIFENLKCGEHADELSCHLFSHTGSVWVNVIVQAGMACVISVNFPFSMFGALQNIEQIIWGMDAISQPDEEAGEKSTCGISGLLESPKVSVMRVLVTVATLATAAVVPDFGFVVGVVGCFSTTLLAFVLPAAFHLSLFYSNLREEGQYATLVAQVIMFVFGCIFCVVSTVQLVVNKVNGDS